MTVSVQTSIFSELADFLVSQPGLDELANYQFPEPIQRHIDYLLGKNSEGELSADEQRELDKILVLVHVMDLTRAKARLHLADDSGESMTARYLVEKARERQLEDGS